MVLFMDGWMKVCDITCLKMTVYSKTNQDAYMEEEGPRGDMTIQSGLSNSTESIDSMKALTAAIEAANAQVSALVL